MSFRLRTREAMRKPTLNEDDTKTRWTSRDFFVTDQLSREHTAHAFAVRREAGGVRRRRSSQR